MKGLIVLNQKEAHRGHVLEQVAQNTLTLKEAARIMAISYRQAKRIHKRWQENGIEGLCHRNRGRQVSHALPDETTAIVVALHEEIYSDFNDTHFTEALAEREGIFVSREKVRQILRSVGRGPKRKRRTKTRHARRPRKTQAGIMMQWDGSPHRWFGPNEPPCCLMGAIDDAESKVLGRPVRSGRILSSVPAVAGYGPAPPWRSLVGLSGPSQGLNQSRRLLVYRRAVAGRAVSDTRRTSPAGSGYPGDLGVDSDNLAVDRAVDVADGLDRLDLAHWLPGLDLAPQLGQVDEHQVGQCL